MKQTKISITVILLFGLGLFFFGTDGFQAFTTETARTHKLIEQQPTFPNVELEDSKKRTYSFDEFKGKYVFITFIYTACTDVCPQLELNMYEVYEQIPETYKGEDIVFLSISFDPQNDTPEVLERYREFFHSDGETWRMARINDKKALQQLLDSFGVIVIPDENGHFQHNSAFYMVDREGTLINVLDFTEIDEAAETVNDLLQIDRSTIKKGGKTS